MGGGREYFYLAGWPGIPSADAALADGAGAARPAPPPREAGGFFDNPTLLNGSMVESVNWWEEKAAHTVFGREVFFKNRLTSAYLGLIRLSGRRNAG
jgi:hypothetical protein